MSEEDVRAGLHGAVAGEPPLDFDPDSLVATARHQVKRRRTLLAAGVATMAVVAVAVAVPVALGRGGTTQVAQPPASTTTISKPATTTPAHYTADELRQRGQEMAAHLRVVVPNVLPKASGFAYGEFGGEAAGAFADGQMYVDAPVTFTFENARYSLFVTVWAPGAPSMSLDEVCAAADGASCKQVSEQDGGPIVMKSDNLGDQTITTLYHFRTSGSVVQVAAYNYDMTGETVPRYMPEIPVTVDQLTRLATDPDLGL